MPYYQIVEKTTPSADWAQIRYYQQGNKRFDTENDAIKVAVEYLTSTNCDNSLTKDEKRAAVENYMLTEDGVLLGILDGKHWYLTYQKDIKAKNTDGTEYVKYSKGENIKDGNYYELEGKTQIAVRPVPGT